MTKSGYIIINGITIYRIATAPVLLILIFNKQSEIFKWMLAISFFTDLIDGFLARKFNITSIIGARLDSIGDDLTVLSALIGLFIFKPEFINKEFSVFIILFVLFAVQTILAIIRYNKITSFHTYLAKTAAIFQGTFFILIFHLPDPVYPLFYVAAVITAIELLEESMLVILLPEWETNVKGMYWVLKRRGKK